MTQLKNLKLHAQLILQILQNKHNYKHNSHNYAPNITIILYELFINGKEFTLRRLYWRDLINGNYLKESRIGIFGYPWYVFNFLQ